MYNVVEGWINYSFAKQYNPQFTYRMGVESAFYCSFYRVATLGSGAGVAAVYYFNEKGIPVFQGTGMYMVEYAIHKVTIAIFSIIFFLLNFGFMKEHYSEYFNLLIAGYVLTAVIATALLLFCCSKKFHGILLFMGDKLNRKGKFDAQAAMLREQCGILEDAAVIPSPAGIGSSEFVFTALFTVLVGTGEAGSAALLYRFATFVLPFVIGGVVVLLHKRIDRRIAKRKADKAQQ